MHIPAKKWKKLTLPRRILAIRLQAMGDLVITLPYLQQLRNALPAGTRLDLLTREEVEAIPREMDLFDRVYSIGGGRNTKKQLALTGLMLPKLWSRRYDVVIDLQNNIISRLARKCLLPQAWSEFDRFSPIAAGESTRLTIEAIGLGACRIAPSRLAPAPDATVVSPRFKLKNSQAGIDLLKANGWDTRSELVVLNPAGAFPTRNWELVRYAEFAGRWLRYRPNTRFLLLGTNFIAAKSAYLESALGPHLINLVGSTTPAQAFAVLQQAALVLSEDSGLMHMAWVSGIPTLAMFGSTRSDRARPLGDRVLLLDSSDLPCGNCMLQQCKFGDTHCLTRYTAEMVFEKAVALYSQTCIAQTS
jgi:heptosyltransferase II